MVKWRFEFDAKSGPLEAGDFGQNGEIGDFRQNRQSVGDKRRSLKYITQPLSLLLPESPCEGQSFCLHSDHQNRLIIAYIE